MSCYDGHTDMVEWLLRNDVNVDQCRDDGVTGLCMASLQGHTNIVKLLLERNPYVNLCDKNGCSPLYLASQNGHTDIVKLLLERNPDVNLYHNDGWSPLLKASQKGHTDIVILLLERNPDPCDKTPLSTSYVNNNTSISNSPSLVQPIMKHKPDINAQTYDGGNALYFSALFGNIEITQLLSENNADSNIRIHSKQYITETLNNHPSITLEIEKQNVFDNLVKNTSSRVTEYVSKKSVDYAFDVVAGSSPLHIACFIGRIHEVCCLIDNNANIDMTKDDGITPLWYACEVGHEDIVLLLLDKKADTKICKNNGKSPLEIATDNGHTSIVEIVKENTYLISLFYLKN
ncbi:ankyrin repeat domain-containing protein 29-like [Mytilus trossulus]|uniref:ankyrin repeat domain-containing protein 29-like n=1 Tax=Mytilus trossulus TaxID=6551 RepID=UPI0030049513